jgi:hypothetical protein
MLQLRKAIREEDEGETMNRTLLGAVVFGAVLSAPLVAYADTAIEYYTPPKMVKQGTNTTAIAGPGSVIVKVLVHPDGTHAVQGVIHTTNAGDNAAALEIATSSTYAPATRGPHKMLAYYDYTIKFTGGSAQASGMSGGLGQFDRELRAGDYQAAQTGLKSYLAAHPGDTNAELELGLADTYLNDGEDATAAFDKVGTIPENYKTVAAKAYIDRAVALLNAKDYTNGLIVAKRAVEVDPGFASYDTRGVAEMENGDAVTSLADIQKAHELAQTETAIPATSRANNAIHLMQADLANANVDAAKTAAAEASKVDPTAKPVTERVFANYYTLKAQNLQSAGKYADAAGLFEQGALAAPSQAAALYASAALAYLKVTPNPDDDKAGATADKALAIDANDPTANYAKGVALANQNKKSDALTFLGKADELAKAAGKSDLATSAENAIKQLNGGK